MSIDVAGLKAKADIVAIVGAYTPLKKVGNEYAGPCPLHGGDGDNFYVNPRKGIWSCFSRGCHECDEGNDVIGFLRRMEGITFQQACEKLGADVPQPAAARATPQKGKQQERVTKKPPPEAGTPDMEMRGLGKPSATWAYHDADGAILGYVARYETPDGKAIRCWTYGARGDEPARWGCGHWTKPRPLYGLDRLADRPGAPILMVEGEKACDAAQRMLGQMVVITWPGGAEAWKHCDLSPLAGRSVLLWPDNDIPGIQAMSKLAPVLADPRGLACKVRTLDPTGMDEGFDAADWPGGDVVAWSRTRIKPYVSEIPAPVSDVPPNPPVEAYADEPQRSTAEPDRGDGDDDDDEAPPHEMSEHFIATRFAEQLAEKWRYVRGWGAWFEWDGDGWRRDEIGRIDSLAVQVTSQALYWDEAKSLTPREKRAINKRSTAGAVREIAAVDRRIAASPEQWDADSWLLGVRGGVIDLKTARMLPPEHSQYITKRCAVAPDHGKPVRWLEYLNRCHSGNQEIIAYLRRFSGYCCTGETGEHALAFLYGTGRNGKGVFLETIAGILGDYAKTASINTFLEQKNPAHSTELARLHKARLVLTEESGAGGKWNESRIKHLTGGGKITARFMRMDDFEFMPNFKLLIASNHKPSLRSVDEAMKARIHLVPFNVTIPKEERDPLLRDKLREEWPQILGWMLDGCAEWQEAGLTPPDEVVKATERYMQSEDILGDWIEESCIAEGEVDAADAYQNYKKWCDAQGHAPWSRIGWSRAMSERDGVDSRRSNGRTIFLGLSLKPAYS